MRSFPTTIDIALTGRCNLRCRHCNTADTWALDGELSFEEIVNVLDELKREKVFFLNLFGGEPFFHPGIHDILTVLNDYPMNITVLTNGTLIDEKAVESLAKMKFLGAVQVSVDGPSAEVHDWQRGEGSFEKAIAGVKLLKKNGLPVKIKAVINRHNYPYIGKMAEMAVGLGFGGMDFGDAVECGKAANNREDMRLEGDIHNGMMKALFALEKELPGFAIGGTLGQKMGMIRDFYSGGEGKGRRGCFSGCPAGNNTLSIRSDGKAVPCSALWTLVAGDVRKSSLREIWDNSGVLNKIRDLADKPLTSKDGECSRCDYLSYCNGGCRAAAYYSTGGDIEGIDRANCLVFSGTCGHRIERSAAMTGRE